MEFAINVTFPPSTEGDRLINELTISVVSNSRGATATKSAAGARRVVVDWLVDGDEFDLVIEIPGALSIRQHFLAHEFLSQNVVIRAQGGVHPRLHALPRQVVLSTAEISIPLDVTFLNVAGRFMATSRNTLPLRYQWPGIKAMAFEFLVGKPKAWMLLVPDSVVPTDTSVQLLLFLRPEVGASYDNCDSEIPLGFLDRYADDSFVAAGQARTLGSYMDTSRVLSPYPNCAFAQQIVASRKKVILVYPVPHTPPNVVSADFGELVPGDNLDHLLQFLRRALFQEGVLALPPGAQAPGLDRLAVAGFSLGGDVAQQIWEKNQTLVNELYLFDPGQGLHGGLQSWVKGDSGRRLRLICPVYSAAQATALAPSLPSGQASVRAATLDYYNSEQVYVDAHGGSVFATSLPPTTERATFASNIIITASSPPPSPSITLRGTGLVDNKSAERTFAVLAPHEAAAFTEGLVVRKYVSEPTGKAVPETVADIQTVFDHLVLNEGPEQPRWLGHRHSWAVVGGEYDASGQFHGFLERCLTESGFV